MTGKIERKSSKWVTKKGIFRQSGYILFEEYRSERSNTDDCEETGLPSTWHLEEKKEVK